MITSFNFLSTIIAIPFIGVLFALTAKDDDKTRGRNAFNVSVFAVITNLLVLWRIAALLDISATGLQLTERYDWLENPKISISLGIDVFSLLLIMAVHAAVLIGMFGARHNKEDGKALMVFSLLFLCMITGFFTAADIFSFYIFFEAMLLPLFMIIGMFGGLRKQSVLSRFFIYNLLGAIFLFFATVILYNYQGVNIALNDVSKVNLNMKLEIFVWGAIFVSFLSRIPIWPFHYWISSISTGLRNPLVFIITNLVPLTGVYGFIRFWPKTVPGVLSYFMIILEIICVISMLFIALIGLINKDFQYKIFSFMTVWYIIYLLAAFLPTDSAGSSEPSRCVSEPSRCRLKPSGGLEPSRSFCEETGVLTYTSKAGSVRIAVYPGWYYLYDLEIRKELRGKGYGSALLSFVLDDLAKREPLPIRLQVSSGNTAALRLYEKTGFRITETLSAWLYRPSVPVKP